MMERVGDREHRVDRLRKSDGRQVEKRGGRLMVGQVEVE